MTPRIDKIAELILSKDPSEKTLGETMLKQWTEKYNTPDFSEFEVGKQYTIAYKVNSREGWYLQERFVIATLTPWLGNEVFAFTIIDGTTYLSIPFGKILAWTEV